MIDGVPKVALQNSTAKIQLMEKYLENFYENQKRMIEQLKFLTLNLNGSHVLHSEDHVSLIENSVAKLYNESVSYVHTVNNVMDIGAEAKKKPLGDVLTDQTPQSNPVSNSSREEKVRSNVSEILDQEEDGLISMKIQINYIYERLCHLYRHPSSKKHGAFGPNLEKAGEALKNNRIVESSQWLQTVLYDPSLDQDSRKCHASIIEEARSLY
jgi:hypothetical protein